MGEAGRAEAGGSEDAHWVRQAGIPLLASVAPLYSEDEPRSGPSQSCQVSRAALRPLSHHAQGTSALGKMSRCESEPRL